MNIRMQCAIFALCQLATVAAETPLRDVLGANGDQFESIEAWDLRVTKTTVISDSAISPRFSPANNRLAFVSEASADSPETLVLLRLPDLTVEKRIPLRSTKGTGIAWAPDGGRIVAAGEKTTVIDLETEKLIELPDVSFEGQGIAWLTPEQVLNELGQVLDLNSLKVSNASQVGETIREKQYLSTHPRLRIGCEPADIWRSSIFAISKHRNYKKLLFARNVNEVRDVAWSSDSRYFVTGSFRIPPGERTGHHRLVLYTFGMSDPMPIEFAMLDNSGNPELNRRVRESIGRGAVVSAAAFAPKTNPLTGIVVGRTGSAKAFGVLQADGEKLILAIQHQLVPIEEGCIIYSNGNDRSDDPIGILGKPIFGRTNSVPAVIAAEGPKAAAEQPKPNEATPSGEAARNNRQPGILSVDARDLYFFKEEISANDAPRTAPVGVTFVVSPEDTGPVYVRIANLSGKRIALKGMNSVGSSGESLFSKFSRRIPAGESHDFIVNRGQIKAGDRLDVFCEGFPLPAVFTLKSR